jgi:hypothetical protein
MDVPTEGYQGHPCWGPGTCTTAHGGCLARGKGALVTGQSQKASLKPLMMTHQLRREAIWKLFVQKKFPP